tara:strand:- start:82 stop:408 length:327 start_codon:yes stop_codon:yes gene_type:complete
MIVTEKQEDSSPILEQKVEPDSPIKEWLVDYSGRKYKAELARFKAETGNELDWNGDVTVEIIIETMAAEFPEFVMALAEENFIRGYRQAFVDVEAGMELANAEQEKQT